MSKAIKANLKLAMAKLKEKEYKEVINLSQEILKADSKNYNAMVFLATAYEGTEDLAQAERIFRKAIATDPSQIKAYMGLCKLLGKATPDRKVELVEVYEDMCIVFKKAGENNKLVTTLNKIIDIYITLDMTDKGIVSIEKLLEVLAEETATDEKQFDVYSKLCALYYKKEKDNKFEEMGIESITLFLNNNTKLLDAFEELAICSFERGSMQKITEAQKRSTITFLCWYFQLLRKKYFVIMTKECFDKNWELALRLQPFESPMGEISGEILKMTEETDYGYDYAKTLDIYKKLSEKDKTMFQFQILTEGLANQDLSLIKEGVNKNKSYLTGSIRLVHNFLYSNVHYAMEVGIQAINNVKQTQVLRCRVLKRRLKEMNYFIALGKLTINHKENNDLNNETYFPVIQSLEMDGDGLPLLCISNGSHISNLGFVYYLQSDNDKAMHNYKKAIEAFGSIAEKNDIEKRASAICHGRLGVLYWVLGGNYRLEREFAYTHLLTAAKGYPSMSWHFEYLGHYYLEIANDANRAMSCYKKAVSLDPSNGSGKKLSDIYLEKEKLAEAFDLHLSIANGVGVKGSWAWFRLGLHYLREKNDSEAVRSFQTALRGDSKISEIWECLGEAYANLGRYLASVKAFRRSLTMRSENDDLCLVSRFRIGDILHTLNLYDDAIAEFLICLERAPEYQPAVFGYSKTLLSKAKHFYEQGRIPACVDLLFKSLRTLLSFFSNEQNDSTKITNSVYGGKLLGDLCCKIGEMPVNLLNSCNFLSLLKEKGFAKNDDGVVESIFCLSAIGYSNALELIPTDSELNCDLAIALTKHSESLVQIDKKKELLEKAIVICKGCITKNPADSVAWEVMGVVCAFANQLALSQHCFIKSLQLSIQNPHSWTNLGSLYYLCGSFEIASKAFSQSQTHEPSYTCAWVGQALISELFADGNAAEYYRHCSITDFQEQGHLGFAYSVYCRWHEKYPNHSGEDRRLLQQAISALAVYLSRNTNDSCAYNLQGLLLECGNFYLESCASFAKAKKLLQEENTSYKIVASNLGRVLIKVDKFQDAIQVLLGCTVDEDIDTKTLYSHFTLAHAYMKSGMVKDAARVYDMLCSTDVIEQKMISDLYLSLGVLFYSENDATTARQYFFKCIENDPTHTRGIFTLGAFGLLTNEIQITLSAMATYKQVVQSEQCDPLSESHSALLMACLRILQGSVSKAIFSFSSSIHRAGPLDLNVWVNMATFIISRAPERLPAAISCLTTAYRMGQVSHTSSEKVSRILALRCACYFGCFNISNNTKNKYIAIIRESQRAVHLDPTCLEGWNCLASAQLNYAIAILYDPNVNADYIKSQSLMISSMKITDYVRTKINEVKQQLNKPTFSVELKLKLRQVEKVNEWASASLCECLLQLSQNLRNSADRPLYIQQVEILCASLLESSHNLSNVFQSTLLRMQARVGLANGKDAGVILECYKKAIALNPADFTAKQELANYYESLGKFGASELCYRAALQTAQTNSEKLIIFIRLAKLCIIAQKPVVCQEALEEALKLDKRYPPALFLLGLKYFLENDIKQSRRYLQFSRNSATTGTTQHIVASLLLCEVNCNRKDREGAKNVMDELKTGNTFYLQRFQQEIKTVNNMIESF